MSWATHDLEPYVIQRKLGLAVAIVPLLVGSYSPDIFTKWFVYGFDFARHPRSRPATPSVPPQLARGRLHPFAGVRRVVAG